MKKKTHISVTQQFFFFFSETKQINLGLPKHKQSLRNWNCTILKKEWKKPGKHDGMLLNIKTLNGKKQIQTERERDKYRRNKPDELLENLRDLRIYKYCLCFKGIQKKKTKSIIL